MIRCTCCGEDMNYNDETTRITEYACRQCHNVEIVRKKSSRSAT
ncbi:hypothetical protein [Halorientalis sp.]|jgi:predicted RNA-binding Zn-ribbon protein involved in translation (DUF1610 family)|nr:hypothetical protein [Halorientalis sp.]